MYMSVETADYIVKIVCIYNSKAAHNNNRTLTEEWRKVTKVFRPVRRNGHS